MASCAAHHRVFTARQIQGKFQKRNNFLQPTKPPKLQLSVHHRDFSSTSKSHSTYSLRRKMASATVPGEMDHAEVHYFNSYVDSRAAHYQDTVANFLAQLQSPWYAFHPDAAIVYKN